MKKISTVLLSSKEENISNQASLSIDQSSLCYRNVTNTIPNSERKCLYLVLKRRILAKQSSQYKVKNLRGKRLAKGGKESKS